MTLNFWICVLVCNSFSYSLSHLEKLVLYLVCGLRASSAMPCSVLEHPALINPGLGPNHCYYPEGLWVILWVHLEIPASQPPTTAPRPCFWLCPPLSLHGCCSLSSLGLLVNWLIPFLQDSQPALGFSISFWSPSHHRLLLNLCPASSFCYPCPTDSASCIRLTGCLLHFHIWPRAMLGLDGRGTPHKCGLPPSRVLWAPQ